MSVCIAPVLLGSEQKLLAQIGIEIFACLGVSPQIK